MFDSPDRLPPSSAAFTAAHGLRSLLNKPEIVGVAPIDRRRDLVVASGACSIMRWPAVCKASPRAAGQRPTPAGGDSGRDINGRPVDSDCAHLGSNRSVGSTTTRGSTCACGNRSAEGTYVARGIDSAHLEVVRRTP
jgi:hypothetical protein